MQLVADLSEKFVKDDITISDLELLLKKPRGLSSTDVYGTFFQTICHELNESFIDGDDYDTCLRRRFLKDDTDQYDLLSTSQKHLLEYALQQDFNLNHVNTYYQSICYAFAEIGFLYPLQIMLEKGAEIEPKQADSIIQLCSQQASIQLFDLLFPFLERWDVNCNKFLIHGVSQRARSSTSSIDERKRLKFIKHVYEMVDIDINFHWPFHDYYYNKSATPLILAASAGYLGIVKWLLEKGALASEVDEKGFSALNYACGEVWKTGAYSQPWLKYDGKIEIIKLLVEYESLLDIGKKKRKSPIHLARKFFPEAVPIIQAAMDNRKF